MTKYDYAEKVCRDARAAPQRQPWVDRFFRGLVEACGLQSRRPNQQSFQEAVLAHAEAEEKEELDKLADKLEPARLERTRKAVKFAESVAPTHPHPGIESTTGNILTGPFAASLAHVGCKPKSGATSSMRCRILDEG